MKSIGLISGFIIIMYAIVLYINHVHDIKLQQFQMQLQIERMIGQVAVAE
jgi:hypothetical protein